MLRMFMFVLAFVTFGIANAEAKDIKVGIILGFTGPIESLTLIWLLVQNLHLRKPQTQELY